MRDICMNTSSFEFWMQRVHQLVWTRSSAGDWCMDECNSCLIAQLMPLHIRNWTLFWVILNFMSMCICLRCSLRGAVWVVLLMHKWFLWSSVNGCEAMRHFCHFPAAWLNCLPFLQELMVTICVCWFWGNWVRNYSGQLAMRVSMQFWWVACFKYMWLCNVGEPILKGRSWEWSKSISIECRINVLLAAPDTLGYESFVRRCEGSRHRQTRELGEGE